MWNVNITRKNNRMLNTDHVNIKQGIVRRRKKITKIEKNFTILYGLVRLFSILFSSLLKNFSHYTKIFVLVSIVGSYYVANKIFV
jgi:cell division protein FtsL